MDSAKPKRRKSNAPPVKSRHRRRPKALPNLHIVLNALRDASAVVSVALASLLEKDCADQECVVLRLGVQALAAAHEQLDAADVQLARFRSKLGGAS